MARKHAPAVLIPAFAALLLAGCVNTPDTTVEITPDDAPIDGTATPLPAGTPPTDDEASEEDVPDESSVDKPPAPCTDNPMASDFAPFLEQGIIPVGALGTTPDSTVPVDDVYYHFQIGENGYDSCAALSYLVLNGSNGDAERSAGIGAAIHDAVVLFHRGEMITSPAPFQMKTVEEVTRITDDRIEVLYGHAGGASAQGVTERHLFTFIHTGEGLTGEGSLPANIDDHARLDLQESKLP